MEETHSGWRAVAEAFVKGAEARDVSVLEPLYHPDGRFWNNILRSTSGTPEILEVSRREADALAEYRFEDVRITGTESGFVLQMTATGTTHGGEEFSVPACLVARVEGDQIVAVDEYVDSAQAAPIFQALLGI